MKVAIEKQEKNVVQIQLEVPADHAQQEYNKACRRIGQKVNIPGFRRGKAPLKMIEKAVGQDRIKQEALERILPHAFADVISEHQLDVVAPPRVENYTFESSQGIKVNALVEIRPEVKLPELAVSVKVPEYKAPDNQLDKELEAIVNRLTTLEPVIDRPVEANDIVNIDFSGTCNGDPIVGGEAKNYRLDLKNNTFIDGFADQLPGHSLGESFTIEVTFPQEYHEAKLAGQKAEFEIKINEINRRVTPDVDDELAKKVGPYENLDALKEEIKSSIQTGIDSENDTRKQKAVIEEIVKQAEVEVPESMVQREAQLLLQEVQARFKSQNLSWEDFMQGQGKETVLANLQQEAVHRIKTSLTFGAIAKQESLTVSESEFNEQLSELAKNRNIDEKTAMRQMANNPSSIQALTDQILAQKVVSFLMEKASFEFVPEEEVKAEVPPAESVEPEVEAPKEEEGSEKAEEVSTEAAS